MHRVNERGVERARGAALVAVAMTWVGFTSQGCVESAAHAASSAAAEERAIPVALASVTRGPVSRPVRGAGTLRAPRELELSFKIGGVVSRVAVDEGQRVRRGQVLAVIDPTEVRAGASQAEQSVEKAERDFARAEQLHAQRGVPQSLLEDAETALAVARASAASAAFNLRHTVLVAPDDGILDRRMIEVGEVVAPGRPVFHLSGRSGAMVVRVALADRDVLAIHEGDTAHVDLDARAGETFEGHVSQVASAATPGSGTFEVEITLDDRATSTLPAGLTAKVRIEHLETPSAMVPVTALVDGSDDAAAVYVVEGERAKRVPVRVGFVQGENAALSSGLEGVQQVVGTGAAELVDGARVRVVR